MRILLTGANGQLGRELQPRAVRRGFTTAATDLPALDITDGAAVAAALAAHHPDVVVNAAAYTAVDRAESDSAAAFAVNRDGPAVLARACAERELPLVHVSTDYVFDGEKDGAYGEDDPVAPLGVYGASKEAGERAVRAACPRHVILRTSWLFSPFGSNFVKTIVRLARDRDELRVVVDESGCPTAAGDLAEVILALLPCLPARGPGPFGTYHVAGAGAVTRHAFAAAIVAEARAFWPLRVQRVVPIGSAEWPTPVRRPKNSALCCARLRDTFRLVPRPWREGLHEALAALAAAS